MQEKSNIKERKKKRRERREEKDPVYEGGGDVSI